MICTGSGVAVVPKAVFTVMAEMRLKVAPARAAKPMRQLIRQETLVPRANDREAHLHPIDRNNANLPYPIAFRSPMDFS